MITKEQAGAIAVLVQTVRTAWDTRAITAALADLRNLDLADVTHAAIRVAQDPDMRTPAAIAFLDPKHWRPTVRETETPEERTNRIDVQSTAARQSRDCPLCDEHGYIGGARCDHNPHTREYASVGAAAARAAIRPPKLPTTTTTTGDQA